MKKKKSSVLFGAAGVLFVGLLGVATPAHAAVLINEIAWMGTSVSANAEWIELFNSGATAVALDGWTLAAQSGSPHITLSGSIAAGGFFLLERTSDASVPSVTADEIYTGALTNSGDTLTLKDPSGVVEDQVVGGSNWQNIGGSNVTKQPAVRTASGWTTLAATPRAANPGNIAADAPSGGGSGGSGSGGGSGGDSPGSDGLDSFVASPDATPTPVPVAAGGALPPPMTADAGGDRTVETGAGSFFQAHVYDKDGVPMPNVRYLWNFGDGDTNEGQSIFYAYPYPGRYIVMLSADTDNGYSATDRVTVDVVPAEVSVQQVSDGSVLVANTTHTKKELNLGLWKLERAGVLFTIPRNTIVLPGMSVHFAPTALKLPNGTSTLLLYPDGMVAAHTDDLDGSDAAGISYVPSMTAPASLPSAVPVIRNQMPRPSVSMIAPSDAVRQSVSTSSGTSSPVSATSAESPSLAVAASAPVSGKLPQTVFPAAGASALVLLGAAGVLYSRPRGKHSLSGEEYSDTEDSLQLVSEEAEFDVDPDAEPVPTPTSHPTTAKEDRYRQADALAQSFALRVKK